MSEARVTGSNAMANAASPLLGYNTNVRHKGKLYHIQTEDSGIQHPHIITHLFADGGRIIASKKTSYAEHVGTEDYRATVKRLMQEQHKAMFIALRDGAYDEEEVGEEPRRPVTHSQPVRATGRMKAQGGAKPPPVPPPAQKSVDVAALERAAARMTKGAAPQRTGRSAPPKAPAAAKAGRQEAEPAASSPGRYQSTRSTKDVVHTRPETESIFGGELLSEKSLDEVILSYLAEDLEEPET